jgi:hypothetical protein
LGSRTPTATIASKNGLSAEDLPQGTASTSLTMAVAKGGEGSNRSEVRTLFLFPLAYLL